MAIVTVIQRFMGITVSAGIFAHDFHYTKKFVGLTIFSIGFLIALWWFHLIIFLKEAKIIEIPSAAERRRMHKIRAVLFFFTIMLCFIDCINNANLGEIRNFTFSNIFFTGLSIFIIALPEFIYRIIFSFKIKKGRK